MISFCIRSHASIHMGHFHPWEYRRYDINVMTLTCDRVTTKFPWQNSRIIQGFFKDLSIIFKDVKIWQIPNDSVVRYYSMPPKKKATWECNHISEKNCREVTCNSLVYRVAAPIWEKLCSKLHCPLNSRIPRMIFKIQGLFKDLPKLPMKFKDFSRIWRTCLKECRSFPG